VEPTPIHQAPSPIPHDRWRKIEIEMTPQVIAVRLDGGHFASTTRLNLMGYTAQLSTIRQERREPLSGVTPVYLPQEGIGILACYSPVSVRRVVVEHLAERPSAARPILIPTEVTS
jgi:hypothetical protein